MLNLHHELAFLVINPLNMLHGFATGRSVFGWRSLIGRPPSIRRPGPGGEGHA